MQSRIKDIKFSKSNHILIIKKSVFKTFCKFSRKKVNYESGGILLGNVYKNNCEIVHVTTPNKYDYFGPDFFVRSKIGAQPYINKAWKKSNGTEIYLGEWHTHFEVEPRPTLIDKNMIINSLRKTKMEIDFLFLIIVGLNRTFWVGRQAIDGLIELKAVI